MMIELNILLAIIASLVGVGGFFAGRQSAAKKAGATEATVAADIRHIKESIDGIRQSVGDHKADIARLYNGLSERKAEIAALKADMANMSRRIDTVVNKTLTAKAGGGE